MEKLKSFLLTPFGQKIKYEAISFVRTYIGAFIYFAALHPVLVSFWTDFSSGVVYVPSVEVFASLKLALGAAFGRSIYIYLQSLFGLKPREITINYGITK